MDESEEEQKAWHIFSLLVLIGKPTPLPELASRCKLFAATPDLISFLCSIPNSPITLSNNNHSVAISSIGFSFFAAYLARNFTLAGDFASPPIRSGSFPNIWLRKRKRDVAVLGGNEEEEEEERQLVPSTKRIRNYCTKVHYHLADDIGRTVELSNRSFLVNNVELNPYLLTETSDREFSCKIEGIENVRNEMAVEDLMQRNVSKELADNELVPESTVPTGKLDDELEIVKLSMVREFEKGKSSLIHSPECSMPVVDCTTTNSRIADDELIVEDSEKEENLDSASKPQRVEDLSPPLNIDLNSPPPEVDLKILDEGNCNRNIASLGEERLTVAACDSVTTKEKATQGNAVAPILQSPSKPLGHTTIVNTYKRKQHGFRDHNHHDVDNKERRGNSTSISSQDQSKPKVLPDFESYIVEEEEGSGGYGTVYRARKKSDGTLVAIKCPHANAHKHYVNNEMKMLERFGGRNFVIRYEGCFRTANSDCLVLEYVEHDRPEVLKREIDVSQLQWYAYCLFKSLANLHKQGIVHRDVKPGNFLFSCKASKGYLIDFNLALDMHQKLRSMDKSKLGYDLSFNRNNAAAKAIHPANSSKFIDTKSLEGNTRKSSRLNIEPKNMKKTAGGRNARNDLSSWNKVNSQADGSGVTSAKDVSGRAPSAERLREPLPCQGRKELISLLQEAMHNPNRGVSHVPAPMRKRVAAPGKMERQVLHPTPMPLNSTSFALAGVGLTKNKGDGKHKREGPCAGTKGFRAPEVLFRSQHQGTKIDIWSAGVTLLYLMIGKLPFVGDPEQNIKDIAKLRGSEDLWEVAKLHNRESSFPEDLYGKLSLAPINLRDWCHINTKRRDFLKVIPSSLYDLVDKCLMVNPRLRITAEDALKHEFFASIHESMRRHRALKQGASLDTGLTNFCRVKR